MEAEFKFGPVEAEPGYAWVLDAKGQLGYRATTKGLPARRFDPSLGEFVDASPEANLVRAVRSSSETLPLSELDPQKLAALESVLAKRSELIEQRNELANLEALGAASPEDMETLSKLWGAVNEQSRQLGEIAAEEVMRRKGAKRIYPTTKSHSTSGDFDQVWQLGDEIFVVEAKGGSGGLSTRATKGGFRAEQGTLEYAKSVAEVMFKRGGEAQRASALVSQALDGGRLRYLMVRAPIGSTKVSDVLKDLETVEFKIGVL